MKNGRGPDQAPLVRRYIRELPSHHSGAPKIPVGGWTLGIVTLLLGAPLIHGYALPLAVAVGLAPLFIVQVVCRPKTADAIEEQRFLDSVDWMRYPLGASFDERFPHAVLAALERVAVARNAELARLASEFDESAVARRAEVEKLMRAAVSATLPVFRTPLMGKREWNDVEGNYEIVRPILEALDAAEARIAHSAPSTEDRLAALRELDEIDAPNHEHA